MLRKSWIVAGVAAIAALLLWLDAMTDTSAKVIRLRNAEFQLVSSPDAQPRAGRWDSVKLPDNWSRQRRDSAGVGWYQLTFQNNSNEAFGLSVKRLSMAAEFYLNGHLLSPPMPAGEPAEPTARMWNTPQYRALPPDWLSALTPKATRAREK